MKQLKNFVIVNVIGMAIGLFFLAPMAQAQEALQPLSSMKPLTVEAIDWRCDRVVDGLLAYAQQLKAVDIAYVKYLSQVSQDYQKWSQLLRNRVAAGGVWEKGYFAFVPESLLRLEATAESMVENYSELDSVLSALLPRAETCTQDQEKVQLLTANMRGFLEMMAEHMITTSEFILTMRNRLESQSQAWVQLEGASVASDAVDPARDVEVEATIFLKASGIVDENSIWLERRFNKFALDVQEGSW